MTDVQERVHIVPMGVEDDRIVEAALEYKAEHIVLLEYIRRGETMREMIGRVIEQLESEQISHERRNVDFENLFDGIAEFIELIDEYRTDEVRVNLATGNKIAAVAGMIACATTKAATPYYVRADRLDSNDPTFDHSRAAVGVEELQDIPRYPMKRPSDEKLQLMKRIDSADTTYRDTTEPFLTKGDLLEEAKEAELPFMYDENGNKPDSSRAQYGRLRRHIVTPLEEKGLITQEEHGTSTRIKLTEDGKNVLTAFRPLIE